MANKSMYTKSLSRKVVKSAKEATGTYFVIPGINDKWSVVNHESPKALKIFITKQEAVVFAKALAVSKHGEVLIQGRDGRTAQSISF